MDDGLKSYDNQSDDLGGDEFFLVEYPPKEKKEVCKSFSDPNVLDSFKTPMQKSYRRCLKEYYNDYADCLEAYNMVSDRTKEKDASKEMNDEDIFNELFLPFKSRSAPDIMDSSFVMLTYDPGPDLGRRKSAFVPGHQSNISEMTVIRPIETEARGCHVEEMLQKHWGSTHTVKIFREPNKSLGISIVGGKVDLHASKSSSETLLGIFVKNVVPDSPAGKTGQFKTGDRILEVCGIDLRQASHEKAVHAIRNATNPVTFVIQSLIPWSIPENDSTSLNNGNSCISPCPSLASNQTSLNNEATQNENQKDIHNANQNESKATNKNQEVGTHENQKEINNERQVKLQTDNVQIEIADIKKQEKEDNVGRLDETKSTGAKATTITNELSEKFLTPLVTQVTPIYLSPFSETAENTPNSKYISEDENLEDNDRGIPREESVEGSDDDDEEDLRDMEGRTVSRGGHQIDRASAANVKRSNKEIAADPEEEDEFGYTMNKVKKKYASLGHTIMMVQLERSSHGLGLSLAGHKDRSCMAVFVCGLNPSGVAYKAGEIQIGDEILEVNGVVLHGRCHLNASAIIKGLSGPTFKVVILRRKTAIDDIAVKPITQFPISLAEEASEEPFSASYPNVRTIAIKKLGNQSLGIMIIEGRHAEVGQGIFISDIQEGSSAEKAGLEIGEMILAVNKDSLVGSNYDTAASLLKRTEGLVTLVVSNPGKKEPSPSHTPTPSISQNSILENNRNAVNKPATLKPAALPSRPTTPVPEPIADPLTCCVVPGRDTTIEIITENKGLGIYFIGGKDVPTSNGIIIVEVYPGGPADKDKRLQPGDQILDVNGSSLKDVTYTTALQALRQTLPKMKMTVYRPNSIEYTTVEVDLIKKPGKGLGLSVVARKGGKGVYIADIINGGIADLDGRIVKGDLLISCNGHSLENAAGEEAGAILKTVSGRVSLKLHRYKPAAR